MLVLTGYAKCPREQAFTTRSNNMRHLYIKTPNVVSGAAVPCWECCPRCAGESELRGQEGLCDSTPFCVYVFPLVKWKWGEVNHGFKWAVNPGALVCLVQRNSKLWDNTCESGHNQEWRNVFLLNCQHDLTKYPGQCCSRISRSCGHSLPPTFVYRQRTTSEMAFSPQENKLTAQTNVFSLQLLNCNLSGDKEDLFTTGSGKDF